MKRHLTINGCLIGCSCMVWLRIRFKVMVTVRAYKQKLRLDFYE
ncbi:hypothetical protein ERO13_D10G105350v2 [Gossypium hirsutum]|nr:hypothetical protein ERO13_D10G105350v2 [Gossypium hirsutum]